MRDYTDDVVKWLDHLTGPAPSLDEAAGAQAMSDMRNTGNETFTVLTQVIGELLVESGNTEDVREMQSLTATAWGWARAYVNDCKAMGVYQE